MDVQADGKENKMKTEGEDESPKKRREVAQEAERKRKQDSEDERAAKLARNKEIIRRFNHGEDDEGLGTGGAVSSTSTPTEPSRTDSQETDPKRAKLNELHKARHEEDPK